MWQDDRPMSILLVDDEEHIRKTVRRFMMMEGWDVHIAANGHEALSKLAQHDFRVVVLDIRMPVINGFEVLGEIKTRYLETVVIILSGVADIEAAQTEALAKGATSFLTKPCKLASLLGTIREALEAQHAQRNREAVDI